METKSTVEGITFIVSAPSGTGKTTTCRMLQEKMPDLKFSISHTTRSPRDGEKEGKDYFFISENEFKEKIAQGAFLEWAKVHNQYYGTAQETITRHRKNGDNIILELDVQGVESLRKMNFSGIFVFILPPSLKELTRRLRNRGTENEDSIQKRIEAGKNEIKKYSMYDFILTNSNVEDTVQKIISIIEAETCRINRYRPTSPDLGALLNGKP